MVLSEKYQLIQKLAKDFCEAEIPSELQDKIDQTGEYPQELLKKFADYGFFGIKAPKELGGQGGDTLAYVLTIEQVARVSMVSSIYVSGANSLGSGPSCWPARRNSSRSTWAPWPGARSIPASP